MTGKGITINEDGPIKNEIFPFINHYIHRDNLAQNNITTYLNNMSIPRFLDDEEKQGCEGKENFVKK